MAGDFEKMSALNSSAIDIAQTAADNWTGEWYQNLEDVLQVNPYLKARLDAILEATEGLKEIEVAITTFENKPLTADDAEELLALHVLLEDLLDGSKMVFKYLLPSEGQHNDPRVVHCKEQYQRCHALQVRISNLLAVNTNKFPHLEKRLAVTAVLPEELNTLIQSINQADRGDSAVQRFNNEIYDALVSATDPAEKQRLTKQATSLMLQNRGTRIVEIVKAFNANGDLGKATKYREYGHNPEEIASLRAGGKEIIQKYFPKLAEQIGIPADAISLQHLLLPREAKKYSEDFPLLNTAAALRKISERFGIDYSGINVIFYNGNNAFTGNKLIQRKDGREVVVAGPSLVLPWAPDVKIDERKLKTIMHETGHAIHCKAMLLDDNVQLGEKQLEADSTEAIAFLYESFADSDKLPGTDLSTIFIERVTYLYIFAEFEERLYEERVQTVEEAMVIWQALLEEVGFRGYPELQDWCLKIHFLGEYSTYMWNYLKAIFRSLEIAEILQSIKDSKGVPGITEIIQREYASRGYITDMDAAVAALREAVDVSEMPMDTNRELRAAVAG